MTMLEDKIARVKALIQKREEIDAELGEIFNGAQPTRRGRPRKEPAGRADNGNASEAPNQASDA
jgi:hypothetical protein